MRIIFLIIVVSFAVVFSLESYAQSPTHTISANDMPLEDFLITIEEQSEYRFFYTGQIDIEKKISGNFQDMTVIEILDEIKTNAGFFYEIMGKQIILSPAEQAISLTSLKSKSVNGKVTDQNGDPLPGVTVVVKNTTKGTVTNEFGEFSLAGISNDAVLTFSFVGMKTVEIGVPDQSYINVRLKPETIGLQEVIAIGYGAVKKSDLTGSVSSVKSSEIIAFPSINIEQSLQGRASGIQIMSNNGEPGSSYKVRIRGATSVNSTSDPLFVVDGFPGGIIPPGEDIESVEVLKDASATAIYGSRGANGVILITTKRGREGETKIEFNFSYSIQKEVNRLDLLETPDFIAYKNEINPGSFDSNRSYPNTDWQDEVLQTGGLQNYRLSLSGGNQNILFYVSGIFYDQKGLIINSRYKRYSVTNNLDIYPTKNLTLGINLFASRYVQNGVSTQEISGDTGAGVTSAALLIEPLIPVYNEDGTYSESLIRDNYNNPVAIAKEKKLDWVEETLQGNFYTELEIIKELKFKSTLGLNLRSIRNGTYTPSTLYAGREFGGLGSIEERKDNNLVTEHYLSFARDFETGHNIHGMLGYSYQLSRIEGWEAVSQNFVSDASGYWNLDGGSVAKTPSSSLSESELASYYGRLNYKLFDRYLLTLNARYDGSSRFAKNNKWAFFPSGAIAWNISDENFMINLSFIQQLKLRTSYGITGNQGIKPYQSLASFSTLPSTVINGELVNAITPNSLANHDLTWESTAQTNVGFDLSVLNNRIQITTDYYKMKTSNLLFNLPLPEYSGYTSILKNIGSIENKGFEFTLSTVNIQGKIKWTTDFNFTSNKNKITELPGRNDIFIRTYPGHMVGIGITQVLSEGKPMGQFFGYVYDGVYQEGDIFLKGSGFEQEPGGEKFKDITGEGILNGEDRTIIGDPNPDYIWGMNNTLSYKNFDFNLFFHAVHGNEIYSFTLFELELLSGSVNTTTRALQRWTPTNTNTDVPKASDSRSRISSSRFVYDGGFIRFKNISLGYQLPKSILKKFNVSHARMYISGQNLYTITKYPGVDPEVNWLSGGVPGSNTNLGLDYGSYPKEKSYTIGLQVIF